MRRVWTVWVLVGALTLATLSQAAHAQGLVPRNPAIENTIQSQIEAFLLDDFNTAFTFASPGIQGFFGSAQRFGQMVREGYPMVHRPAQVEYRELARINGALWQKVVVTDAEGRTHSLAYQMVEGADGWRINGVTLIPEPSVGV